MLRYVMKRLMAALMLMIVISMIVFCLIQLPPGDFLSTNIAMMEAQGTPMTQSAIDIITKEYSLDKPIPVQYIQWMKKIITRGDFGKSFSYNRPVSEILAERLPLTILLSVSTIVFTWIIAFPAGIVAALKQYSWIDYLLSCIGFIGVSIPGFMLALVGIYVIFKNTGIVITGLFSPDFLDQPMSFAKFGDLLKHIWFPIIIIGVHGTASLIRTIRGQLLDEMEKQYITAAKARGMSGRKLLFQYPIRVAINPLVSTVGWMLPNIVSGESIIAVVINLQTMGPVLLKSLQTQDMYLAGSILLMTSFLSLIGTMISDILLALLDPRIRMGGGARA